LYRTCGRHALLPKNLRISIDYDKTSDALYNGGYADVWKGRYLGRDVAVKVLRSYSTSDLQKVIGGFCKEVVTWRTLHHPNVLGLIGVTMTETKFAMISDWMANRNIRDFVKENPGANRFELVNVANGLIYLHSQGMIHGDLKGANVLIDDTRHDRLADFGLLKIISDPANPSSSSSCTPGGSTRWMSPELIDPRWFKLKKSRPTESSDCYALGMVIYETVTEKVPFHQEASCTIALRIMAGEHPLRGERFTDSLWEMLEKCWIFQPNNRPRIEEVLQRLKRSSGLPVQFWPESDNEKDYHGGYSDSTDSLSSASNVKVDVPVARRAAKSSGLDHLASRPVHTAHVNSVDPEVTNLSPQTPWTNAGVSQVIVI
ncbi:kinase-like domain-containing protein, partial [Thelephora terrestris]